MKVISEQIGLKTNGEVDIIDITSKVQSLIHKSQVKSGITTVFVPGSTAAITTIEYEPGLLQDLPVSFEKLAPEDATYEHEKRWHDGNGHSHVRAALLGTSLTIPIKEGKLTLGTWQQLVLIELDTRSRSRELIVQILGE